MKTIIYAFLLGLLAFQAGAQDVIMQAWYWDYPSENCTASSPKWAVNLQSKAAIMGDAGFTYVWLPPPSKGGSECSVGYDPKDLYDLGDHGATRLGSRAQLNSLITALQNNGMEAVADVVYNHRDGGNWEDNPAVRNYVMNYPAAAGTCNNGVTPYPVNGKVRWRLPLGGTSGNGAGIYYFKFSSSSAGNGFYGRPYDIDFQTSLVGSLNQPNEAEVEPNGGGDCGTPNDQTTVTLGVNITASIDNVPAECGVDEFKLELKTADFNAAGDYLDIYVNQINGDGTGIDIRPYGLYSAPRSQDIIGELVLQTRTNFNGLPSGLGGMSYQNFKPNGIHPTCLEGDWDFPYFFFDVEQRQSSTQTVYNEWSKWLLETAGFSGGLRMDAVKHFDPSMVRDLLNYLSSQNLEPEIIVGEIFDADVNKLNGWVNTVNTGLTADVNVRVFDFNLRESLKDACDQHYFNFFYDVRNVFNSGMQPAGASSFSVVTFVNNHDFRGHNEPVQADPLLAYVYILTNNKIGLPCVFYPDFFADQPPNYPAANLESEITKLIQLHQEHIFGAGNHYYLNRFDTPYASDYNSGNANQCLIYQISGGPSDKDVIVAINFDDEPLRVDQQIDLDNVPVGARLDDVIGNSNFPYAVVSPTSPGGVANSIYIDLPARSYSVWVHNPAVPLPADLLHFKAEKKGEDVQLEWQTAQEDQLAYFRIERAVDGTNFVSIGRQEAVGNSRNLRHYTFLDNDIEDLRGDLYYRLLMVDADGTEKKSEIRKVSIEKATFNIWPNPSGDQFHIVADFDIQKVQVYNVSGQLIHQLEAMHGNASPNFNPNITLQQPLNLEAAASWEPGLYHIVIEGPSGIPYRQRIIKL